VWKLGAKPGAKTGRENRAPTVLGLVIVIGMVGYELKGSRE